MHENIKKYVHALKTNENQVRTKTLILVAVAAGGITAAALVRNAKNAQDAAKALVVNAESVDFNVLTPDLPVNV